MLYSGLRVVLTGVLEYTFKAGFCGYKNVTFIDQSVEKNRS